LRLAQTVARLQRPVLWASPLTIDAGAKPRRRGARSENKPPIRNPLVRSALIGRRRLRPPAAFPHDFKPLAHFGGDGEQARPGLRVRGFCLTIERLSILTASGGPLDARSSSSMPDQRGNATIYGPVRAWHVACDSALANGFEPFAARQQKDIAMHTSIGAVAERPFTRRLLAATAGLAFGLAAALPAEAQDTIKVGILHSLSGTMAISETTLKDVMLMLIEEQNKKGGLLGKKLEAVVVDPASNWPLFAEKARELITKDKVAVVFGCWTSVSRKSVLPVFKELNSILFYPVQYEGEESERNVFYTGAAPNQQAIPAVDYLMSKDGGEAKRWVLAGTDYVYPRTTNKILEAYLKQKGVADADIMINYTPFGHSDWQTIVSDIKKFGSAGKKTAVVSTINGDANVPFYKELGNQGVKATDIPSVAFSVGEEELAGIDTKPLLGHLAAWNYFQSIKTPINDKFIADWKAFIKNPKRVTNDPMEAHVIGFAMWVKAVEKVKSTDPDKVIDALPGIEAPNLTGGTSKMLPNHHITKPVFIGEVRADGQFDVVWKTPTLVPGDAWSKYLPGSKDLEADWVTLKCGNYNTVTKKCGGA
jgi:urea transport system substrate-binding protein